MVLGGGDHDRNFRCNSGSPGKHAVRECSERKGEALLVPHRQLLGFNNQLYEAVEAPRLPSPVALACNPSGGNEVVGCCGQPEWVGCGRARLGLPVPSQAAELCGPNEGPSHLGS
ncbi:hypothetical protein C4D60_Mb09t05160 [Musa balbisiana]|uniref:Uncharacterized protein n=1 Tax=Musa balbisiana TaxID=52838 RepID=A0A4S8IE50_MUSBA|nr:hypothetical protein C4D60_Mb09t05160 [Musa balbisiana]